jgi:hypothetical protein
MLVKKPDRQLPSIDRRALGRQLNYTPLHHRRDEVPLLSPTMKEKW